jgi:hypoxanthine phosphoribosyltransferase
VAERNVLIGEDEIQRRVSELAAEISRDYAGVDEIYLVGILKGAFIFLADLSRQLTVRRRIEFVALSSYGVEGPSGEVRLLLDLRHPVTDKHVIVVDDILDTGRTLRYLVRLLSAQEPASLRTCVLVRKPDQHEPAIPIDYLGFDIPDVWVVGYGLDYKEQDRTLPYIAALDDPDG